MKILTKIKQILKRIWDKLFRRNSSESDDVECDNNITPDGDWVHCYIYNDCMYDDIEITINDFDSSGLIYEKNQPNTETEESLRNTDDDISDTHNDDDVENVKSTFTKSLIDVLNVEREHKGLDKIDRFPEPDNSYIGFIFRTSYDAVKDLDDSRKEVLNNQTFTVANPNDTHVIWWYDNRDLYDIYSFSTAEDGHACAEQICSDEEKFEKLQNRRRYRKTCGSFDDAVKSLDELCIRVEYIITTEGHKPVVSS